MFFILTTRELSVNRNDLQAGPPRFYQGSGPSSFTTPWQLTLHNKVSLRHGHKGKKCKNKFQIQAFFYFFIIRLPPELLPVLGLLEWLRDVTLGVALLCSSRAGADLGHESGVIAVTNQKMALLVFKPTQRQSISTSERSIS